MFFRKFKTFLSDYFTFTTRERRGTMWLLLIITLQLMALYYLRYVSLPQPVDLTAFGAKPERLVAEILKDTMSKDHYPTYLKKAVRSDSLFSFDPNRVSATELEMLGLSSKQAKTILRFREKGGRFRCKADFAKMYAIGPDHYRKLEPYLILPEEKTIVPFEKRKPEVRPVEITELNSATAEELDQLPMIGPSRAERIIRYREALGGFVAAVQIREVYGIDSTAWEAIRSYITVNPEQVTRININNDSLRHPYLSYKMVKIIRSYRKAHGNFRAPEDIRNITLFNDEIYRKIAPYLTAE